MTRQLLGLAFLAGLHGLSACGGGDARDTIDVGSYVALGDSYTSAPGVSPVADADCQRSGRNYPHLLARQLRIEDFVDVSCGGAGTGHLLKSQRVGQMDVPPQLDALRESTELVTIGLGLNDFGVSRAILYDCVPRNGVIQPICHRLATTPIEHYRRSAQVLAGNLARALETIADLAPRARIVVVGYPRFVPSTGACPTRWPVPPTFVERVRLFQEALHEEYRKVAQAAGASYADLYTPSEGHDVCSDEPWVNDVTSDPGEAAALHPFGVEQQAAARVIAELLS